MPRLADQVFPHTARDLKEIRATEQRRVSQTANDEEQNLGRFVVLLRRLIVGRKIRRLLVVVGTGEAARTRDRAALI
jgi:hypothetical protein